MKKTILAILAGCLCLMASAQTYPYQNPSLSPQERAEDLLGRLTLEQKASLMMHHSPAIDSLGIRAYDWWNEALHGAARSGLATVFPQAIGMAASWDEALLEQVFDIASTEQRIKFIQCRREKGSADHYCGLTVWTPNINIFRDPRWGRGQETYGEDPYLTYRMGKAVVNGLQGRPREGYDKLHACLKHFAVHSGPESTRHSVNISDVSYRDLRETYLYAFERIVKETDVQEVMCAYNRLDGKPCCGSDQLLQHFLREKWGYKGLVVSDCGAIDDFYAPWGHHSFDNPASASANAVRTGTDLECGSAYRHLVEAVESGQITEADIDRSVLRLLVARFRLGEMDEDDLVPWNCYEDSQLACEAHHKMALKMARESIVLLRNNDGVLPLKPGKKTKYAIVGPTAKDSIAVLGNYNGTPRHAVTVYEGIVAKVGEEHIVSDPKKADVVIYVGGITPQMEGEEMDVALEGFYKGDRTTIELPKAQREEIASLKTKRNKLIYLNMSGSAVALKPESEVCDAILQIWYGGEAAGEAVADVLLGDFNPCGKLPVTFYASDDALPDFNDYDMAGRTYRYFGGVPLWDFGFGLGYSAFKYSDGKFRNGVLSFKIKNCGKLDGDEVAQVYIQRVGDEEGPNRSLCGFKRISIPAGRTVTVEIPVEDAAFSKFDPLSGELEPAPGRYHLYYGSSSAMRDLTPIVVNK